MQISNDIRKHDQNFINKWDYHSYLVHQSPRGV